MASLPSPTKVSGKHNAIYEAYFKLADPKNTGSIEGLDAAKFLKKSGLSDVVLSRIWDLSDPKGRGYLDKAGFFVSLKLVALAQAGHDINMRNIFIDPPNPPKVGEIPKILPQAIQSVPASNTDWSMKIADRLKYEELFDSLKPVNGLIAGNKVKGVLMESKLPLDTLGKIWDLADQDKDGSLDKHEFTVAMHLVYQALDKRAVPSTLPPELQKPKPGSIPKAPSGEGFGDGGFVANFPKDIAPPPVPPLPSVAPPASRVPPMQSSALSSSSLLSDDLISVSLTNTSAVPVAPKSTEVDWVITPSELIRYERIFRDSDRDKDGLVSGFEIKNIFLQSGVPQNCLAHIWALCDTNQSGKLTVEQFALAMWMVDRKKSGIEPPETLAPNMIPPSLRSTIPLIEGAQVQQEVKPTYSNPELEMISKEIEELAKERRTLETDIAQKEADIRIKSGEVRSLQSELDTLAATLKQLENQRGEAQKRLDDLKAQKTEIDEELSKIDCEIEDTRRQVDKIREQCRKQEETINEQESELNSKRSELQKLKDEEASLEKEYEANRKELENLTKQLQDTQLQISQVKAMVTQLLEAQRQMNDALLLCKAVIENNDGSLISDYSLKIEPDLNEAKRTLEKQAEQPKLDETSDPFQSAGNDAFGERDAFTANGFGSSDPFGSNAHTNGGAGRTAFDDSFNTGFDDAFSSSAFPNENKDPFTSAGTNQAADPFGDKKAIGSLAASEAGKDDFGSDPFAILHAPTSASQVLSPSGGQKSGPPPRPESPSPALPPKKAKQPPPRPAPPRPLQAPNRPAQPTSESLFSSTTSGSFANFADFDNKQDFIFPPQPAKIPLIMTSSNATATGTTNILPPKIQQTSSDATSLKNSTATNKTPVPTVSIGKASPSIIGPPVDFREDPFKDYRYEDPFHIKDPFDDDESPEDTFATNFSQNKIGTESQNLTKTENLQQHSFSSSSNRTTPSSNIIESFANFDPFKDPQDQYNGNFLDNKFATIGSTATKTAAAKAKFLDDSFFKNSSISPPASNRATELNLNNVNNNNSNLSDPFNDLGNFTSKTTVTGAITTKTTTTTKGDDFSLAFPDDPFFDALNDNLSKSAAFTSSDNLRNFKNTSSNVFDAFGGGNNTTEIVKGDGFNDNFEDDFCKMKISPDELNTNSSISMKAKTTNLKTVKLNNNIHMKKIPNESIGAGSIAVVGESVKISQKFADDYSKPEDFDEDLKAALERSVADK